jgi:hypothetical protein
VDTLPPELRRVLTRWLLWLCATLVAAFVAIAWWRLTQLSDDIRESDRRITRIEAKLGLEPKAKE